MGLNSFVSAAFLLCGLLPLLPASPAFAQPASALALPPSVADIHQFSSAASAPGASASSPAAAQPSSNPHDPVRIESVPHGAALDLYAINDGFSPISLSISLTKSKNTGFAPNVIGAGISHLIDAHSRKLITMAVPLKKVRPMEFAYVKTFAFGDNLADVQTTYRYRLPIPDGSRAVLRVFSGLPYKTNFMTTDYAVELLSTIGTSVVAARPGIVFLTNDTKQTPVPHPKSPLGDYILILHDDGGWAIYGWLLPGSLKVKTGNRVDVNQVIAAVGPNPSTIDTYLLFGVARNLGGATVATIPFTFTTKTVEEINPKLWVGPISPDLSTKYPPTLANDPWNPADDVLPTPPVRSNFGDEDLSPLARQNLYRQRIIDHANAGRETVGDSSTLVFLGGLAVALSVVGLGLSLISHGRSAHTGARGWIWSLLHGSQPSGSHTFDPSSSKPLIVGPVTTDPSATSAQDHDAHLDPALASSQPPSSDDPALQSAADVSSAVQRLHDPSTLELIRHVSNGTPLGLLSTHSVPARSLLQASAPSDVLDFVLVRANDGSVVLVILRENNRQISYALATAGVPNIILPADPTAEQVMAAIKAAIT